MTKSLLVRALVAVFLVFNGLSDSASDVIGVDTQSLADFKADRPDFSSDNSMRIGQLEKEIDLLNNRFPSEVSVDLESEEVRAVAPVLSTFIVGAIALVAERAKIKKPGVMLRLANDHLQYNAAAIRATGSLATVTNVYKVYTDGRKELDHQERSIEPLVVTSIEVGAALVRLFSWRQEHEGLFAAVLAHEIGHIVFEHNTQEVQNEYQADFFAAKLLKRGQDLITTLDMISLAAHAYNSLKDIVYDRKRLYQMVNVAVSKIIRDVEGLGELGKATSHAYVATAVFNAVRKADAKVLQSGEINEAYFELYQALRRACLVPTAVFGVPKEEIEALCLDMERKAEHLKGFKQTHPVPVDRKAFISAVAAEQARSAAA